MPIERDVKETVAEVEVSDLYGVTLRQLRPVEDYSPAEARALATELLSAARAAEAAQREDEAAWAAAGERFSGAVRPAHGFDAAPVCRECAEGKHGACTGIALVDTATFDNPGSVDELPCGCSRVDHQVIGGVS